MFFFSTLQDQIESRWLYILHQIEEIVDTILPCGG